MRIIKIKGQLGNQMFQYAFAQYIAQECKTDIMFDSLTDERHLAIKNLSVECNFAPVKEIKETVYLSKLRNAGRVKRGVFTVFNSLFNSKYFFEKNREYVDIKKLKNKIYLDGYWQNWRYLEGNKDLLKKAFYPKNGLSAKANEQIKTILSRETVCLGIRLGDYTKEKKHFMVCDENYYRRAINYCISHIKNPLFYVFSNDIEGAKKIMKEFDGIADVIYREQDQVLENYEELWVMASCKHSIIPNSTFHWWGAWLKDDGEHTIIAPEKWFGDGKKIDIVPTGWIKM